MVFSKLVNMQLAAYIYIYFFSLSSSLLLHVHLREGTIMETVVPAIRQSGVDMVYVRWYVMLRCDRELFPT
jgi:hypothetical protein